MNTKLNKEIDLYFKYIQSMKDSINTISSKQAEFIPHLKHLACVGLLDTMAKCVANPRFNNYKRFTEFVKRFCEWKEHSKISLPHLVRFLQLVPSPDFGPLRKFANNKLSKWTQGEMHYLDSDPTYQEVLNLWPKDKEPLEKLSLESITHLSLLWQFRNSIVHEFQIPGYGMLGLEQKNPCYHSMTSYKGDSPADTWELVYPVPFMIGLIDNGIRNLKQYCIENCLNPYDYYKFGSYWIDKLN